MHFFYCLWGSALFFSRITVSFCLFGVTVFVVELSVIYSVLMDCNVGLEINDCGRTYCSHITLPWIDRKKWTEYWENLLQASAFSFQRFISLDGWFLSYFVSFSCLSSWIFLWRDSHFCVLWLLGHTRFPFMLNSLCYQPSKNVRFYTLYSDLDTKELSFPTIHFICLRKWRNNYSWRSYILEETIIPWCSVFANINRFIVTL